MTHHARTTRRRFTAALALAALAGPAAAQGYPERPVELVVPFSPGGGTDAVARAFADAMRKHLPQPLLVVNKPGASGAIGLGDVANAKPDGYKLAMGSVEIAMLKHMGVARFGVDEFAPVIMLNAEPSAISVRADAPWRTVEEFLAHAKAKAGEVRVGNSGTGAIWHMAAESLGEKAGIKFLHVPYAGAAPAITDLLGGHIEAITVSPAEVAQHVAGGKIRLLAVMSAQRYARFADVPTLKEKGIEVQIATWRGIVAPRATPPAVLESLRAASAKAAQEQAFRDTLTKLDLSHVVADATAFRATMERDNAFFSALMQRLGLAK